MSNSLRKIKRNIIENKYGVRASNVRGVKKKLHLLEEEVARKTQEAFDGSSGVVEEADKDGRDS